MAGRRPTAETGRPTRRTVGQPDRLPRAGVPATTATSWRPCSDQSGSCDDRRLPTQPLGQTLAMSRVIVVGAGVVGLTCAVRLLEAGPPGRRGRPGPAAGDDLGRGGRDLVPLPRPPAGPGHRLGGDDVRRLRRARRRRAGTGRPDGARHRAAPRAAGRPVVARRGAVADPGARLPAAVRRRLELRRAGRRDAGLPALAGRRVSRSSAAR